MYQYNSKERETALDLHWYDYGARQYDVQLGRWNGADPLAEKYYSYSSYNYVLNNPVKFVDPDGRDVRITIETDDEGALKSVKFESTFHVYGKDMNEEDMEKLQKKWADVAGKKLSVKIDGEEQEVSVEFDLKFEYHETMESARDATDVNPGDNFISVDASRNAKDHSDDGEPFFYAKYTSGHARGRHGNARSSSYKKYGLIFHEAFHLLGFKLERYGLFGSTGEKKYEADILDNSEKTQMIHSVHHEDVAKTFSKRMRQGNYDHMPGFLAGEPTFFSNSSVPILEKETR